MTSEFDLFDILPDLTVNQLKVYLLIRDCCYKGKKSTVPRLIAMNWLAKTLDLSYKQVRGARDKLITLGLIQKFTTIFMQKHGTQYLPTKATYYRLIKDLSFPK